MDLFETVSTSGAESKQPGPKLGLGPCPVHAGQLHVQLRSGSEWLCLRGLADLHEPGEPPDQNEALRFAATILRTIAVPEGSDQSCLLHAARRLDDVREEGITPKKAERTWSGPYEYTPEDPDQYLDGLEDVPNHRNDLGDWCPYSNSARTADGTCPQFCQEADDLAGVDAGRDNEEEEEES